MILLKKKVYHLISKKKKFYKLVAQKTEELEKLQNSVNFENLMYYFKGSTKDIDFNDSIDVENIFD